MSFCYHSSTLKDQAFVSIYMEENQNGPERERDHQGRYSRAYTDEDLLNAVTTHEPAATSEVAEELGVTRQSADQHLRRLADEGKIRKKKIGASLVWFRDE